MTSRRPRRMRRSLSIAALVAALALVSCARERTPTSPAPPSGPPDVLLITLDTFRADRAGCMGNPAGITPTLDAALRRGILASNAFAPAPLTAISHASLLTGLEPPEHGVRENAIYRLPDSLKTIPGLLRKHGFKTSGFIAGLPLSKQFGFSNGFDHYDDTLQAKRSGSLHYAERPAEEVVDAVLASLDAPSDARRFVWAHFFDAHHPRRVLPALAKFPAPDDYEREIRGLDLQLDRLFRGIEERSGEPVVVISTDHGEGLGSHAETSHGVLLYEDTMHAIFGISAPAGTPEAERLGQGTAPEIVRFVDLLPTLFAILDLEAPESLPGRSLLDPVPSDVGAYGETYYSMIHYGWSPLLSMRTSRWTYIEAPQPELYDRTLDPGETRNVLSENTDVAHELAARLRAMTREPSTSYAGASDDDTGDQLASLGYISGLSSRPPNRTKNPKEYIGVANALIKALSLQSEGRNQDALVWLQRAYRNDPENFSVLFTLADCLRQLGDSVTAMAYYRKAVEIEPGAGEAVGHLAVLTFQNGDVAGAFRLLDEGLQRNSRSFALWMTAGGLTLRAGKPAEAAERFRRASELEPSRAEPWVGLAEASQAMNQREDAQKFMEKARSLDPESALLESANAPGGRGS